MSDEPKVGRRPWLVCAVWFKHPKHGRCFRVGTELLPDLPINHNGLIKAAKESMTSPDEPPPDEVYFGYTSFYD